MLTKVEIRPVTGSAVELNTTDGSGNHLYPLSEFNITTNIDQSGNAKRMAAPGQWPTFHYPDAMTIIAEGRILGIGGSDSARSADYVTKRLALLDAALPPAVGPYTSRHHGVLRVRMDGMTEDADAQVVLIAPSIPLAALYPAQSEFMLTWKAFEPYFIGVSTSTKYQLG